MGTMKPQTHIYSWIEVLFLAVLGLGQIQCSQNDSFNVMNPTDVDGRIQKGEPWTEKMSMQYNGRFHAQALFVLDNSQSMSEEIAGYISMRIQNFMAELNTVPGLTYQIGLNDTNYNVRQGNLLAANGVKIVTEQSPASVFSGIFGAFLQSLSDVGSGAERGLASAAAAVMREQSTLFGAPPAGAFLSRRIVIISDMNDTDNTPVGTYAQIMKSVPEVSLFPIIAVPNQPCSNPSAEGYGTRYVEAVGMVGGKVSSICKNDFNASLTSVFEWIQNVCMTLTTPVAQRSDIQFFIDEVQSDKFELDDSRTKICVALPNQPAALRVEAYHAE
jgi:hypothetical protein